MAPPKDFNGFAKGFNGFLVDFNESLGFPKNAWEILRIPVESASFQKNPGEF